LAWRERTGKTTTIVVFGSVGDVKRLIDPGEDAWRPGMAICEPVALAFGG
jgi:hypothetical protein